jgi:hypothetical protein
LFLTLAHFLLCFIILSKYWDKGERAGLRSSSRFLYEKSEINTTGLICNFLSVLLYHFYCRAISL